MVQRTILPELTRRFRQYPVVTLTGPRQSGKTTLCRAAFPDLPYVNLEQPDMRAMALDDPRGLLDRHPHGLILDEIQRAPELPSYLQVRVDDARRNGMYVITGSQQLTVTASISQSLAGRTALLRLLPFSIAEADTLQPAASNERLLYTGFYPRIWDQGLSATEALADYVETYVERDVRQIQEIRNLAAFRTFLRLAAGRVGQLVNLSTLGADAGVSHTTAREWMGVLEASFIAFLLPPYHANLRKRLVKSPKLYFHDVGLASYLLGIERPEQVVTHPLRGGLFENLAVVEALKHCYNLGRPANLHFYRDASGLEVDLLLGLADKLIAIEIKAGATVASDSANSLERLARLLPQQILERVLVYGGSECYVRGGSHVVSTAGFAELLGRLTAASSA